MKRALWLGLVIMMAPAVTFTQSKWSVSPAAGFYKAKLDKDVSISGLHITGGVKFGL